MNAGDTGFMMICAAMVFFMTPGLAFFYGGPSVGKMLSIDAGLISDGLSLIGYHSLSFGGNHAGIIGDFRWFALNGIGQPPFRILYCRR